MIKGTISSKNQITIPIEMVRKLGIKAGDKLTLSLEGNAIVLKPIRLSMAEAIEVYALNKNDEIGIDATGYVKSLRGWQDE